MKLYTILVTLALIFVCMVAVKSTQTNIKHKKFTQCVKELSELRKDTRTHYSCDETLCQISYTNQDMVDKKSMECEKYQ